MAEFRETRDILTKRPVIEFVEPEQIPGEQTPEELLLIVDEARNRTLDLIQQYKRLEKLTDIAQARIDRRAEPTVITLDVTQDVSICNAMTRVFGPDIDCTQITYAQYKQMIDLICNSVEVPTLTSEGMQDALTDPFKKNFGGFGGAEGSLRPELKLRELGGKTIEPVNLDQYKVKKLVQLIQDLTPGLRPIIIDLIKKALKKKK